MTELFAPNEEELDQMILEVQQQMEEAESQLEYDHLHDRLKDLRNQKQQLLIQDNIL
ncbi:hypothetical protein [Chryseobacterium sp. 6424]|uniref:hypothetical protein n=1 Tax=Chryseobacterium sp. 6424 TaxID=2039166 RepID=UPI0013CF1D37|nr:hypothetical protein [Chryseobacterium sp. 6424]